MTKKWYHLAFLALCAAVLAVLLLAPEEKTSRLPPDETHARPKEFAACPSCHEPRSGNPMPADHLGPTGALRADHVKCYMCHKLPKGPQD